jgi:HPt (histidine-containing phosphotransfer) domain-containing protein
LAAVQVVNKEHIDEATMGDAEFALELASVFVDDTRNQLLNLHSALRSGDCTQVAALAHRVKGASGNMGAECLSAACAELERAIKSGEPWDSDTWVDRTGLEFQRVTEELERIIPGLAA